MKITFDLFNGHRIPSNQFKEWLSGWWYSSEGHLPVEKGTLRNGDEWLFIGWFFSEDKSINIISRFVTTTIETLYKADGEFILVLYSKCRGDVKIYRDRTGILPLFYGRYSQGMAISTCMRNVAKLTGMETSPSPPLFVQYPVYRRFFAHKVFQFI